MEAYSGFAKVYDLFMDNIPYEEWTDYVKGLFAEEGITEGILLDLGCGTGSVTEFLAKAGFDMIAKELERVTNPKVKEIAKKNVEDIKNSNRRDFRF